MNYRNVRLASLFGSAALLGLCSTVSCTAAPEDSAVDDTMAALTACHLNDGTVEHDALIRSCDAKDTKKTTICHVPPGNPANAHTICIGNAAVPAHLGHHGGDHLGPCQQETKCPTVPGSHDGGGKNDPSGQGGTCAHDSGVSTGTGGDTVVVGGTGGNGGGGSADGGIIIVIP